MIIILSSALIAILTSVVFYMVLRRYKSQSVISERISNITQSKNNVFFSNPVGQIDKSKNDEITLDELLSDNVTQDFFLGGVRNKKMITFYQLLNKLSFIVPSILLVYYFLIGALTQANLIKAFVLGAVIFLYIRLAAKSAKQKRQKRILKQLPQFLDLLVVCVEAGLGFTAAIERLVKEVNPKEPLTKEFASMYHEFLTGLSLAQACERLDKRCGVPELSFILGSIVQSDLMGASLGNTLRIQALELRDKTRQRIREKALKIPVKILLPILPLFICIFIVTLGPAIYTIARTFSANNNTSLVSVN